MTREHPAEPTADQCEKRAQLPDFNGRKAFACWYPQMGGYVGKCVVVLEQDPDHCDVCFEAFVWHDGAFPFSEDGEQPYDPPAHLHHCMPSQFISFGAWVLRLQE